MCPDHSNVRLPHTGIIRLPSDRNDLPFLHIKSVFSLNTISAQYEREISARKKSTTVTHLQKDKTI